MNTRRYLVAGAGAASLAGIGAAFLRRPEQRPALPSVGAQGSGGIPNVVVQTHTGASVRFYDDLVRDKFVVINMMYAGCNRTCPPIRGRRDRRGVCLPPHGIRRYRSGCRTTDAHGSPALVAGLFCVYTRGSELSDPLAAAPRAALVTRASSGLSAAITLELASRGWHVLAASRSGAAVADRQGRVQPIALDVTDEGAVRATVEAAERDAPSNGCCRARACASVSARMRYGQQRLKRYLSEQTFFAGVRRRFGPRGLRSER